MNLILHIGPPKTGSTSIQNFLSSAQQELLSDGVLYPSKGRTEAGVTYQIKVYVRDAKSRPYTFKKGPHITHHLLAWALAGAVQNISADRCWADVLNEIDRVNPETVVISSESFAWLSEEQLQTLKGLLKDFSVKVLIYFRNPFNWLLSRYNQVVKKGRYHRSFRAFMQEKSFHYISYQHLMKRFVGTFGHRNVDLRLFDKIKRHDSLENDLIQMMNLDASKYVKYIPTEKHNVSLANDIMNMLRCINFYQHYFRPQAIHSARFKRNRNKIIRKRKSYRKWKKIGRPFFNRPLYGQKDLRIYSTLSEEWLPEFLRQYLNPEDWKYYNPGGYEREND